MLPFQAVTSRAPLTGSLWVSQLRRVAQVHVSNVVRVLLVMHVMVMKDLASGWLRAESSVSSHQGVATMHRLRCCIVGTRRWISSGLQAKRRLFC